LGSRCRSPGISITNRYDPSWGLNCWGRALPSNYLPVCKRTYAKRLITLGLTITLGFSAISVSVLWESRDRDREHARQSAANLTATISSEIARNLELYDLSLQAVVDGMKLPDLSRISPELRQLLLFDRAATAKDMGSIFVLDKSGTVIIDSRTLTPRADNHAQSEYFKVQAQITSAGPYVSKPWIAPNGEYLIAISRRLSNPDGTFSGAVVGTLRLSYFHDIFRKLKLSDRDVLALIREDGTFVMRSPFEIGMIGRDVSRSQLFQKVADYPSGSFEDTSIIDGVERMYVFQRVGKTPLIVSYGLSLETIYADWRQEAWRIGLLMLALCATNIALVVFLARALKRRSEAEYQLAIAATTDGLTGLCNRRRLDEMLDIEWRRALRTQSPVALLMIDVDKFKTFNDQFGHQAGDAALAAIARCIESNTRRATDISARYGGEEFAVVLPGMSIADAFDLAEQIRAGLLALGADQQGRPDSTPTVSIGVASTVPRQGLQPRDLIKAADTALYEAKTKGRNRTEPSSAVRLVDTEKRLVAA
jgi:diguanylate cyclase (GGDEF)-like protein